jgi:hypothetical protein
MIVQPEAVMRTALLMLLALSLPASAQSANTMCGECGVVRSVREVVKQIEPSPGDEAKPSGLVATVPLDGSGKPRVGPSQRLGKDQVRTSKTWEVNVLLDDGRSRVITLDREPKLQQGDKVRIDNGQVVLRGG